MAKADLTIADNNGVSTIRVFGRANFECGMPLRSFAKNLSPSCAGIVIDMAGCESMDSTFMGLLTMLSMRAQKINLPLEVVNASDYCRALLRGLGVEKRFKFVTSATAASGADGVSVTGSAAADKIGAAEAVVEAHQTLMDVSLDNIAKFEKVVEFAQSDLDRLKKEAEKN
ncbi:MAG: STAS domain-containing protein [Victivallaceae bacterium]|nr:STAS domain-containing protein [Victivallaceae bacterium]